MTATALRALACACATALAALLAGAANLLSNPESKRASPAGRPPVAPICAT